jgi:hypothetical protein
MLMLWWFTAVSVCFRLVQWFAVQFNLFFSRFCGISVGSVHFLPSSVVFQSED